MSSTVVLLLLFLVVHNSDCRCYSNGVCTSTRYSIPNRPVSYNRGSPSYSIHPASYSNLLSSSSSLLSSSNQIPSPSNNDLSAWSVLKTAPMSSADSTKMNNLRQAQAARREFEMNRQIAYGAAETIEESKIIRVPVVETRTVKVPRTKYQNRTVDVTKYERVKEPYTITQYKLTPVQRTVYRTKLVPKKTQVVKRVPVTTYEEQEIKESKGYQLFRVKLAKNDKDGTTNRDTVALGGSVGKGIPVVQQDCPNCLFNCPSGCMPVHRARAIARRAIRRI